MEQWRELRPQWNEMLANSPANQLFMTWEWLDCWLRVQPAKDLFVICVHGADDKLLGVAPLYKADYTLLKVLPYRVLRVIGDVDSGAEYQTWIARALDEDVAYAEIVRTLQALRGEWDLIWMPKVGSWFGSHEAIVRAAESGQLLVRTRPCGFSTVQLPENYDAYMALMSSNRRQQVRRNTKKFLSKSGVKIRQVATQEDLGPALAALFILHDKRRRSIGEEGVFDRNPREREFYERFARVALDKGWLAMFVLYDHAEPKAVQFGYIYNGVLLQMQEGFDPDYLPHVGNALRAWVIRLCIQWGLTEYDFLGGHSEHKRRWLATERTGMDLLCMHSGIKNLPLRIGVWPTGKYLHPS